MATLTMPEYPWFDVVEGQVGGCQVEFFGRSHRLLGMSRTLILKNDLYDQFARGAAQRGLTVQTLLERLARVVDSSANQTPQDRTRSRRIERLLAKSQDGPMNDADQAELDRLIDEDYQAAIEQADRRIETKRRETSNSQPKASRRRVVRSPANASRGRRV